jgi:hypothetical protein
VDDPLADVRRQLSPAGQQPGQQVPGLGGVVERVAVHAPVDERHRVLLQVASHVGVVDDHLEAVLAQVVGGPHPGQHQELGRPVGAGRQHDLPGRPGHALGVLDPDGPAALDHDPPRVRVHLHDQVLALARRLEEGLGRAVPPAAAGRRLQQARALHLGAVVVVDPRDAGGDCRVEERLPVRREPTPAGHVELAVGAVELVAELLVVLGPPEQRQDLVVAPPGGAEVPHPAVEVAAVTAHVEHRVHRRRPADHPAAREIPAPPVEARLGLGQQVPVARGLEQRRERGRRPHAEVPVAASRLQKADARPACAEPVGQDAPGRPRPDDDVVELGHRRPILAD